MQDGIYQRLPRDLMSKNVQKFWDFYHIVPGAPLYQQEFGYYCLDKWKREEGLAEDADLSKLFGFDEPAVATLGGLGGCEASFVPEFETVILEDRGEYELVQDHAGRHVLYFKNRRNGFMPEYVDHPVKDFKTWEEKCKWRMDPASQERINRMHGYMPAVVEKARKGFMVQQYIVGGYMYLRSLIGPTELLFMFYDEPTLIHDCMKAWFILADTVLSRHQQVVSLDEILLDEDICYNHGSLISPDMMKEFIFPYYQQLIQNAQGRQLDHTRKVHYHLATDGFVDPVIQSYMDLGVNRISPFEVASNCDVMRTGAKYPELLLSGGIDKRVLAKGKAAIDEMIDRILPAMQARGGYIPTCDHGVPEEVSLENYMHYRKRCLEFS